MRPGKKTREKKRKTREKKQRLTNKMLARIHFVFALQYFGARFATLDLDLKLALELELRLELRLVACAAVPKKKCAKIYVACDFGDLFATCLPCCDRRAGCCGPASGSSAGRPHCGLPNFN